MKFEQFVPLSMKLTGSRYAVKTKIPFTVKPTFVVSTE